jgi:putative intracellular protease/amidase
MKVLILVTSHALLGDTQQKTGFWLEELAVPYLTFTRAGATVDLASPSGGQPPADPRSEAEPSADVKAFLADPAAMKKLAHTIALKEVTADYDAVFVAGGHGVMFDLATSKETAALLSRTWAKGHVVAAVCHGPAALVGVTTADGTPLVKGRTVSAFTDEEERAAGLEQVMPFLLESRLASLGAKIDRAPKWQSHAVRDGQLVTGQNPASSRAVAQLVLEALKR